MKSFSKKVPSAHKTGDKLERVGEKISNSGSKKIGQVVHDAGDKLEHLKDKVKSKK